MSGAVRILSEFTVIKAVLVLGASLALGIPSVRSDDNIPGFYNWRGGDGSVTDGDNWDPDDSGPPGGSVPGTKDGVTVNTFDSITLTGNLDVKTAGIDGFLNGNTNTWGHITMAGSVTTQNALDARDATFQGNVTVGSLSLENSQFNKPVIANGPSDGTNPNIGVQVSATQHPGGTVEFAAGSSLNSTGALLIYDDGSAFGDPSPTARAGNLQLDSGVAVTVGAAGVDSSSFRFTANTALEMNGSSQLNMNGASLTVNGDARIGFGGINSDDPSTTTRVNLTGGSTMTVTGDLQLGLNDWNTSELAGTGLITVVGSGSKLTVNNAALLGAEANCSGNILVQNGGELVVKGQQFEIGSAAHSLGLLTIDGTNSLVTGVGALHLVIGNNGDGTLQLLNGGQFTLAPTSGELDLGVNPGSRGTIAVDGSSSGTASTFSTGSANLVIGAKTYGELDVTGGGKVFTTGTAVIARDQNSTGNVTISGASSRWAATSTAGGVGTATDVVVGQSGTAQFTINQGAKFTGADITIAQNSGSIGTMNADGNVTQLTAADLTVGDAGTGTLNATNSAGIGASQNATVGNDVDSQGTLSLDTSSKLTVGNLLAVGNEFGSTGTLNVKGGASVTTANFVIGQEQGGHGMATFDGATTKLMADQVTVGLSGTGTLTIQNGFNFNPSQPVSIGFDNTGVGTLTVTGAGTVLQGDLDVGESGQGTLNVTKGAMANLSSLATGTTVAGTGSVKVDGTGGGANLTTTALTLAQANPNTSALEILNGGKVAVTGGAGVSIDSSFTDQTPPSVHVSGSGSALTLSSLSSNLTFGQKTASSALIEQGGTLSAGNIIVNEGSKIVVTGAGSEFQGDTTNNGTLEIDNGASGSGGALQVAHNGLVSIDGTGSSYNPSFAQINGNGHINILNGGSLTTAGSVILGNGDVTSGSGTAGLTIGSSSQLSAGNVAIGQQESAAVAVNSGGVMNAGQNLTVGPFGSLKVNGAVTVTVLNIQSADQLGRDRGTVGGSGTINGNVINGGKVNPGDPQTLAINGDYEQDSGGVLEVAVAGTSSNAMDHLVVNGQLTLMTGAILQFDFINGFAPKLGDKFDFLNFSTIDPTNSMFSQIQITGLAPGFEYTIAPDPTDPLSYALVALNDGVSTTSVPEPSVAFLLTAGAFLLFFGWIRRQRNVV